MISMVQNFLDGTANTLISLDAVYCAHISRKESIGKGHAY